MISCLQNCENVEVKDVPNPLATFQFKIFIEKIVRAQFSKFIFKTHLCKWVLSEQCEHNGSAIPRTQWPVLGGWGARAGGGRTGRGGQAVGEHRCEGHHGGSGGQKGLTEGGNKTGGECSLKNHSPHRKKDFSSP